MGAFARNKGKRGEREVVLLLRPVISEVYATLRAQGLDVGDDPELKRNTLQSDNGGDDIVGIPGFSLEVKNCAKLQLNAWWKQCVAQAGKGERPVLLYKVAQVGWRARTLVDVRLRYGAVSNVLIDVDVDSFLTLFSALLLEHVGHETWVRDTLQRQNLRNE